MNGLLDDELKRAEALVADGRLQEARSILADFIRGHPDSAEGWFLLSFVAPESAKQVECLERALKLDPGMSPASLRLAQLTQAPPSSAPNPRQGSEASDPRQGSEASYPRQGSEASYPRQGSEASDPFQSLDQTQTPQIPAEDARKVSPFFDNDFDFSDAGAFQPAPQAPKSWFDELQAEPPILPVEAYPQPVPAPGEPISPEPTEGEEELAASALVGDLAPVDSDPSPHLPEAEELVTTPAANVKTGANQLTRDQKIWLWVLVIAFFLVLLSFGILYIATLSVLPTLPPTVGFARLL